MERREGREEREGWRGREKIKFPPILDVVIFVHGACESSKKTTNFSSALEKH